MALKRIFNLRYSFVLEYKPFMIKNMYTNKKICLGWS